MKNKKMNDMIRSNSRKITKAEQTAADNEIRRQIKRQLELNAEGLGCSNDATVLLTLNRCFGFGKKRLRKFWDSYIALEKEMSQWYETSPINSVDGQNDLAYYGKEQLKKVGVDVAHWRAVKANWNENNDEVWNNGQ